MLADLMKLHKAIVQSDFGMDLNTSEQALDELASRDNDWVRIISERMANFQYGDAPVDFRLPKFLKLVLSKGEDGFYTGFVCKEDPMAGDHGEVQVQFLKLTPESIVTALKAREYIAKDEGTVAPLAASMDAPKPPLEGLLSNLSQMHGDIHIHIQKSKDTLAELSESLAKFTDII